MKKILFVGNGVNLLSDGGASWESLLNELDDVPNNEHEVTLRKAKPFTLWFEEIATRSTHKQLKQKITNFLKIGVGRNKYHTELMKLKFNHILTTNYDYNLEAATNVDWKPNPPARENFYSMFRRRTAGNRHIWHIHGELNNVGSIMLGHEQYSGYVHKIMNFLNSGIETSAKDRDGKPYLSKYSSKIKSPKGDVESWVDLFIGYDVHVVGFGLDYTENHLWHLITLKHRLGKKNISAVAGRTIFHRCSDQKMSDADEAKLSILNALGVETKDYVEDTYAEAYGKCIASLK